MDCFLITRENVGIGGFRGTPTPWSYILNEHLGPSVIYCFMCIVTQIRILYGMLYAWRIKHSFKIPFSSSRLTLRASSLANIAREGDGGCDVSLRQVDDRTD